MKTLKLLLVALVATLSANLAFSQKKDSLNLKTPIVSIDDGFIISRFTRTMDSGARQILFVSQTPSPSGYNPIKTWTFGNDTIGKNWSDSILSGFPKPPIQLYIKLIHVSIKGDTLSGTGQVTISPKAKIPDIMYANTPFNNKGKIYVNHLVNTNREGTLYSYAVFSPEDTLKPIARKSWTIPGGTGYQTFNDSSYFAGSIDVWINSMIKNAAGEKWEKWTFVPAFIAPTKPELGISVKDSTPTILKINGWCITKNLNVSLKIVFGSGDTLYLTIPASNGLSSWSSVVTNRTPGKTYTIVAYATNIKGTTPSNTVVYKMPELPKTLSITSLSYYTDGNNLVGTFGYYVPSGETANATLDYDTDSLFEFPKDWKTFYDLTGTGSKEGFFIELDPGDYYLRCQINNGTTRIVKIIHVKIHPVSVKKVIQERIVVYPNPTTDVIHSNQPISLFNSLGQEVGSGTDIFVENLPKGFYSYRTLGSNTYSGKILKE